MAAARALRRILDTLYLTGGIIASFFLIAILTIIANQLTDLSYRFIDPRLRTR